MTNAESSLSGKRLLSLDVFRGLTIAGMILVNSPGNGTAYRWLEHAEWNGCEPADLVFPFFVFILGVSLVFSFAKRRDSGQASGRLFLQILQRTAIIFALGIFLNGFHRYDFATIRIPGVLQRIALCYFFAAILYIRLSVKQIAGLAFGILIGYWLLMTRVPVPDFGAGNLTREGNLAAHIDRALLAGHTFHPAYDPEGILSTLPAVATALLGILTGYWLRRDTGQNTKVLGMFAAGVVGIVSGALWGHWFPINKALWTSSYVLYTGGLAFVILGAFYWLIEVKGFSSWGKFFEVFGVNGLAAYFLSILDLKIQNRIKIADPDASNLRLLITRTLFESWTSPVNASLCYAAAHTLLWFAILYVLYRKKIFIKV